MGASFAAAMLVPAWPNVSDEVTTVNVGRMTAPDRAEPGRGARLPAAERRRQLLDMALEAFAANGFHVTSMDDIAEAAGVTKPVLYQHFRSKRALYIELLDDVGARLMESITKATATASGPRQQVEAGFAAYFRFVAAHENAFRLLFGSLARRDEEFSAAVRRVEDSIAEAIADLIDADIDAAHQRLLAVRNDVGLLSEEYDLAAGRMLGNFPQAFSHVALINTAANLSMPRGPAQMRRGSEEG